MDKEELRFNDDKIYCFTPLSVYGDGIICKKNLVMTKEVFIECYKKWIEPQESEVEE